MLLVLAIVYRNNFVSYMIFWFASNLICSERKFSRNRLCLSIKFNLTILYLLVSIYNEMVPARWPQKNPS